MPVVLCLRVLLGPGGVWLSDVAEEERLERVLVAGGLWVVLESGGERSSGVRRDEADEQRALGALAVVGAGW